MSEPMPKAAEVAPAKVETGAPGVTRENAVVAVTPTQVRRPLRTTLRSTFQAFLALCVLAPILTEAAGLDPEKLPWLVVPLAVAAAVTRVMAVPQVEEFLRQFLPFLAAAPNLKKES